MKGKTQMISSNNKKNQTNVWHKLGKLCYEGMNNIIWSSENDIIWIRIKEWSKQVEITHSFEFYIIWIAMNGILHFTEATIKLIDGLIPYKNAIQSINTYWTRFCINI